MKLLNIKALPNGDYILTVETGGIKIFGYELSPKVITRWKGCYSFSDMASGKLYNGLQLRMWVCDYVIGQDDNE